MFNIGEANIVVAAKNRLDFRLRSIGETDIEKLRVWKNDNKASFFLQDEITPLQQSQWYELFCTRKDDYMFIVEQKVGVEWFEVGCMGFRELEVEACVDAYNIMRSRRIEGSSFTMSEAFFVMLSFANQRYFELPIRCKVLCDNPAVKWYEKNSFSIIDQKNDYYLLELEKESLADVKIEIRNI